MAWSQHSWSWSDSRNDGNQSWYGANRGSSTDYRCRPYHSSPATHAGSQQIWTPPAAPYIPPPTLPSKFVPDDHHYDSTSLSGFSFKKSVEATLWSRKKGFSARDVMDIRAHELMFHGVEEWSLRLLSHGRPDSVIPTRSVAESILGSQILSVVRKKHYDIDGTAEAIWRHVHPGKGPPSKNSDSTQLFQPMIDMMLASIASFAPTQQSSKASQNLIKLETELEKRGQQLRQQGVVLTPEKGSSSASQHPPGHLPLPIAGHQIEQDDSTLTKLDAIPAGTFSSNAKKLQGQSIPAVQTWCKTFKKTLGATKFAEFEELTEEIASQIDDANNKLTKDKSRELAIKFGLPMSAVNKMGVKSLASVIALASVLAA